MLEISRLNLEADLIEASIQQPVLLDIWAPWCGPCKVLGPVLEGLEKAYAGRFKLTKLNSDSEPEVAAQLSKMFGVRSIPFCVLFKDGQPVDGFVGALPETDIRAFLDKHVAGAGEAAANGVSDPNGQPHAEGDTGRTAESLQESLAADPGNDTIRYDLLRALLEAGRISDARTAFEPVAQSPLLDTRLAACGHWIAACERMGHSRTVHELEAVLASNKRDFETRFELAQVHFSAQRFTEAMDELLEIIMRDKTWSHELARKTCVAILTLMSKSTPAVAKQATPKSALETTARMATGTTDPVVDKYRRRLSMALF
jgi:putative thioredoxin